jgi:hypothetical protein
VDQLNRLSAAVILMMDLDRGAILNANDDSRRAV